MSKTCDVRSVFFKNDSVEADILNQTKECLKHLLLEPVAFYKNVLNVNLYCRKWGKKERDIRGHCTRYMYATLINSTQNWFGQNILKDIRTQDQTDETSLHETLSGKYLYYATFQLALSSVKHKHRILIFDCYVDENKLRQKGDWAKTKWTRQDRIVCL